MDFWMIYLLLAVFAGFIASTKERSAFGFFLLAVLLTPLIGILYAVAAQRGEELYRKPCPECAELVREEALKCRYCGAELPRYESPLHKAGRALGSLMRGR